MKEIIFTQGISASGKTTWAEQFAKDNLEYTNINRDDIRGELFCDGKLCWDKYKFTKTNEKIVTQEQLKIISENVSLGRSIIISDTNLSEKTIQSITDFVNSLSKGYTFTVKVFDIDFMEAVERDAKRERSVGYKVISSQYNKFRQLHPVKQDLSDDKINCVVVDIDGTLADMTGVRTPFEWDKVGLDNPRWEVINMLRGLIHFQDLTPVFVSGRDACCMKQTQEWLEKYIPELDGHFPLFMRPEGDMRKDTKVKREIFDKYISHKYNVVCVLDDRPSVTRMWAFNLGLNVINVGNPYFEF